jgi:hypothetical protein
MDNMYGIVYLITNNITNQYYIGKKALHKGKPYATYWGSCKELTADIKQYGKHNFTKEILKYCVSSYELSYCEIEYLIKYNWLNDKCYNGNISGKYFKSKLNPKCSNEHNDSGL